MPRTKINKIIADKSENLSKRGRKKHTLNEKLQSLMRHKPKQEEEYEDEDVLYDNNIINLEQDKEVTPGKSPIEPKEELKQSSTPYEPDFTKIQ